ncbi:YhdP family protein [Thalassotalea marina]|uniref:DUF3971 domain-containing protein n=1 Tax=Thalassotalea marina TaxID=1673741 RepID=A0A919BDV5_9GAMM|nr:YhdP family protein [Thalassotalea marina]GHF82923.1 DUF3971 domain-containing protein [Thalassotalea marina]
MSMSKVSNRWLNRVYKIIAILLVIFAVLISGLRLFLPYAHNYRIELQDYINSTYGSDIAIGSLNMSWQSSGPILVASNVSVLQTDSTEVFISGFNVQLDFWRSLQQRQLVTKDFALDGVKVLLDRDVLSTTSSGDSDLLNNVSKLFLHQISKFSVDNSQIIVKTANGDRTFLIDELFWVNQGKQHKAKGSVVLDGVTSNNLQLDLNITGETLKEMHGQLYIQANQLDITPWLDRVFAIDQQDTHSSINFNAWLTITKGKAERLLVDLGENKVTWTWQEAEKLFAISPGQLVIKDLASNNALSGYTSDLMVTSDEHVWQPLTVEFNKQLSGFNGYISSADISGVTDLLPLFIKEKAALDLVEGLSPQGVLQNIFIKQVDNKLQASAKFSGVNTQYQQGIPGVEQLSGELHLLNEKLQINISANAGAFDFAEHFQAPLAYDEFNAAIELGFSDEQWSVSVPSVEFIAPELKLTAELGLFGGKDKETHMSLFAQLHDVNVVDAPKFYPQSIMGQSLIDYLNSALKKGNVKLANVLVNGPIKNFPFEDGTGYFNVDAKLTNSTFIFDEKWPAITHFDANLNFTNNSMLVTGLTGSLTGIDVAGVTARIDDLSNEQVLQIKANFNQTQPKLVTNLMLASPLSDTVGNVLEKLVVAKPFSGNLDLTLPINDIDATVAKGEILLVDNSVDLQTPDMQFTQVNGKITFENEKVKSTGLDLLWRNMPLKIAVNTAQLPVYFQTKLAINANWASDLWLKQLPAELQKYGEGQLNWQGELVLNNYNDGDFTYNLSVNSDLANVNLTLPEPFTKSAEQSLVSNVKVVGNLTQSTVDAHIGEQLTFYGKLDHEKTTFTQSHLILGNEPMFLPVSGFHVTSALAEAAYEQWQPFIVDLLAGIEQASGPDNGQVGILPVPDRIRGNINKVTFIGESLHDVSFNLTDETSWWLLSLSSLEARANIKIFPDIQTQGLEINADYVRLAPNELLIKSSDDATEVVDASEKVVIAPFDIKVNDEVFPYIPPLTVSCGECSYRNLQLGKVDFQLRRPTADLLTINNFVAKRKGVKLQLDGQWQHNSTISNTALKGTLESNDVERELERLGISSTVADSGLKASFDINWLGGPQDFQIRYLNGDVTARLDEGVLKEVPDSARALSLLSLQSLVRKLKFDFRDIFADGMFYSEIKGDYHLQNGVLYTKNTFLKGAAGDMSLKGNTDLNTKTLDYSMSYAPNVTSSLPAIAWIATLNPVTFLAGVAIDGVITSQVPVEYKFALTGSIAEPNFRQIDKKTKNISVGRDSPPKVVEALPEFPTEPKIEGILNPETGLIEPIDKHQLDRFND